MDKARIWKVSVSDYSAEVRSPVVAICQVTERGVVFTSSEDFEVGDSIELGFHVRYHEEPHPPEARPTTRSEFIKCEGQVVGSILCAGRDGLPIYEVTLLFTAFERGDSHALVRYSELESHARRPQTGDAPPSAPSLPSESVGLN
jgi:hypothetical protein